MKIVYSFNKTGYEAEHWKKEIRAASNDQFTFIPFNHVKYLNPKLYIDSVKLDILYQSRNAELFRMYADFEAIIRAHDADAILVTNCPPYHPDFLKKIPLYKALYSTDDPGATYMRTIPYLHAYNHVFYVAPPYSVDMDLADKMRYCGMVNADWLPISVFDFEFDTNQTETTILAKDRDIDIIYIGGCFVQKLDILKRIKRVFGRNFRLNGFFKIKHNLYFNIKHGYSGWVRPVSFQERVQLYQRTKIGFNIHWNEYGLGNQRLYHLPANGVMQICDCPDYLGRIFEPGKEIVAYKNIDDLLDKLRYFLNHDNERKEIALNGYKRVIKDYRFKHITRLAGKLIQEGMDRIGWRK